MFSSYEMMRFNFFCHSGNNLHWNVMKNSLLLFYWDIFFLSLFLFYVYLIFFFLCASQYLLLPQSPLTLSVLCGWGNKEVVVWWPAPRGVIAPALVCEHLRGNVSQPLQACRDGRWLERLFLGSSHYKPARVNIAKGQEICWVKACRAVQCRHGLLLGIFPCIPIFQDQQIIPYVYIDMYSPILNCYCLPKSSK